MLGIMLPAFLLAMYEKDGLPLEKVVKNIIRAKYLRPGVRPYKTGNIYAPFTGQAGKEAVNGKPKSKRKNKAALSAQQSIPYVAMHPDGVCQLPGGLYTKTVEYEDINYSVASTEDQSAIFSGWSSFLNYFDSALPVQLSFINRRSHSTSRYHVNIPAQADDFDSIRGEFVGMLKRQIARSNNGIERSKYITFGVPAEGIAAARPRLDRVEADVMGTSTGWAFPRPRWTGGSGWPSCMGRCTPGGGSRSAFRGRIFPERAWGQRTSSPPAAALTLGAPGSSGWAAFGARRPIFRFWRPSSLTAFAGNSGAGRGAHRHHAHPDR